MQIVAIVISFGRLELCELLACWERQTVRVPLLLWLDGPGPPVGAIGADVHVYRSAKLGNESSIGEVRAAAVNHARTLFALSDDDAFLWFEDDDFYSSRHVELTTHTLQNAEWTGARRLGLQRERDQAPFLLESTHGPGQQGTWAMRLRVYDQAGGYTGARLEDVSLGQRIGWRRCASHTWCTHVRRELGFGMSHLDHDRESSRARSTLAPAIEPRWSSELADLEHWCARNLSVW